MDRFLAYAQSQQAQITALLKEFVECESPSDDPAAVNRFVELVSDKLSGVAKVKTFAGGAYGKHMRAEFALPGRKKSGIIMGLGHSDTVYPLGTLKAMPWKEADGKLWGPGIFDMKGGVAFFIFAMQALRELDVPIGRKVILQLNSDEEIGSPSSRPLTEALAKESAAVLVMEPSAGADGKAKTGRKGVGDYEIKVFGKAAHAGLDFAAGANAIVELAKQIEKVAGFTRQEIGLTVNPGIIRGGTRTNVVPAEASVEVDIRISRLRDAAPLDKKFRALKVSDKRCRIEVTGGLNRPPMERTKGVAALYKTARKLSAELGLDLGETVVGGGSDGNFTAGLGIPTLDGIGAVGDGAHTPVEHILIARMADRTALLAKLVAAL